MTKRELLEALSEATRANTAALGRLEAKLNRLRSETGTELRHLRRQLLRGEGPRCSVICQTCGEPRAPYGPEPRQCARCYTRAHRPDGPTVVPFRRAR